MGDHTLIIGAGPAGLAAGYELMKTGVNFAILEAGHQTGGMSRTVEHDGFRFDLGPHRFYTKIPRVQALWEELLGDRLMLRHRLSRIAYRGQLFHYPLRPLSALRQLGPATALAMLGSFARARLAPIRPEDSFEAWVTNRFGKRLYEVFFKTYTEKVWGMPCTELSADWAAQRIRELSLRKVLTKKLFNSKRGQSHSLIDQFHYPPLGPQEMWDELANRLASGGQSVLLRRRVSRVRVEGDRAVGLSATGPDGAQEHFDCDAVISTMPLHELVQILDPPPPGDESLSGGAHSLHPPLYYILMLPTYLLFHGFGDEAAMRAMHCIAPLFGVAAVWLLVPVLKTLTQGNRGLFLFTLGLIAVWPNFVLCTAIVNNDAASVLMAVLLLNVVLVWRWDAKPSTGLIWGLTLGLAALAKFSNFIAGAGVVAVALIMAHGRTWYRRKNFWRAAFLAGVGCIAVCGAWWVRNLQTFEVLNPYPLMPILPGGLTPLDTPGSGSSGPCMDCGPPHGRS